jgi:hypothetical protein
MWGGVSADRLLERANEPGEPPDGTSFVLRVTIPQIERKNYGRRNRLPHLSKS